MALEAGVSRALVGAAIDGGKELTGNVKDVYLYAKSVAKHEPVDSGLMERIEARYNKASLLEFGVCIATAKVFPTIKRAVGYAKACSLIEIEV